jgi:hypothetical protein
VQKAISNDVVSFGQILRDVFGKGDLWFRTGDLLRVDKVHPLLFSFSFLLFN